MALSNQMVKDIMDLLPQDVSLATRLNVINEIESLIVNTKDELPTPVPMPDLVHKTTPLPKHISQDVLVSIFINECCNIKKGSRVLSSKLNKAFNQWRAVHNLPELSSHKFIKLFTKNGYVYAKKSSSTNWFDLELKPSFIQLMRDKEKLTPSFGFAATVQPQSQPQPQPQPFTPPFTEDGDDKYSDSSITSGLI